MTRSSSHGAATFLLVSATLPHSAPWRQLGVAVETAPAFLRTLHQFELAGLVERSQIARLYHSETFTDGEKLLAECGRRGLEHRVEARRQSVPLRQVERVDQGQVPDVARSQP